MSNKSSRNRTETTKNRKHLPKNELTRQKVKKSYRKQAQTIKSRKKTSRKRTETTKSQKKRPENEPKRQIGEKIVLPHNY